MSKEKRAEFYKMVADIMAEFDSGQMKEPTPLQAKEVDSTVFSGDLYRAKSPDELRALLWKLKKDMESDDLVKKVQGIVAIANIRTMNTLLSQPHGIPKEPLVAAMFATVNLCVNLIAMVPDKEQGEVFMEYMSMVTELMRQHPGIKAKVIGPAQMSDAEMQEVIGDGFVMNPGGGKTPTKH